MKTAAPAWYEANLLLTNRDRTRLRRLDRAFRLHHVPNWFRRAILKANREQKMKLPLYSNSGGLVFGEYANRLHFRQGHFWDHWGSCEGGFATQPYMEEGEALEIATTVAKELGLLVETHPHGPWFSSTIWIRFFGPDSADF